jgi:ribosomal protein S18 acetylase RimI-like enzyme
MLYWSQNNAQRRIAIDTQKQAPEALYQKALTVQEINAIETLRQAGHDRGVHYKVEPAIERGIVCRRGDKLTGFMSVDFFGGDEVESAAIAGDGSDWEAMKNALVAFAGENSANDILFIAAPQDRLVTDKLLDMGLTMSFAEYRMRFDLAAYRPAAIRCVTLRPAASDDRSYIIAMDGDDPEDDAQWLTPSDLANTRIILQNGCPVGKVRIEQSDGAYGIYGFEIEAPLRGRGLGAQALTLVLDDLVKKNAATIYLEVDTENAPALHLYKKMGFHIASEFRYYPYELSTSHKHNK